MEKNKIVFIFLLFLCAALVIYAGHLLSSQASLSQPQRSMLYRQGGEYIINLNIINPDSIARNHTISVLVDGKHYNDSIYLKANRTFTYKHHIYPPLKDKHVNVSVYKEGELVSESIYIIDGY